MKSIGPLFRGLLLVCLPFCAVAQEESAVLFGAPGGWGVSTVPREGFAPVAPGRWAGRIPADEKGVSPPPPAPFRIPRGGNPWRGSAGATLSHRFPKMLSWLWSRTGALPEGREESFSFKDAAGKTRRAWLALRDEETGAETALSASRRLRQGRRFSVNVGPNLGDVFLHTGSLEDGALAWHAVTGPTVEGPLAFQLRLAAMDGRERFLTLSVRIELPEGGEDDVEVVPFEPRVFDRGDDGSFRFPLALTAKTVNFPSVASVALAVGTAPGAPAAPPAIPFPEGAAEICPCLARVEAPEGTAFRDAADALAYVELRSGGLFEDAADFEAMSASLARDATGAPRVRLAEGGRTAELLLNPDPDLETSFNAADPSAGRPSRLRPNRAERLLAEALAAEGDVVVRLLGEDALDYGENALRMADHPATFEAGVLKPAVRLSHAECEFVSALARRLHADGRKLFVVPGGPGAAPAAAAADGICAAP